MESKVVFRKDTPQTNALLRASKDASATANRASRALGLTVTYIKDGTVYEESAEGTVHVIRKIEENIVAPFEIKKGLVLRAK
ncbi:hypothetical protein [Flavobacterium sp. SM2513]|uniref:hypothetical protein n=1 Tax=Flavobacterium sp. SM2513 TaxID=3424766 RepID=UPI003D7FCFD6